jgi:hypothetical protein
VTLNFFCVSSFPGVGAARCSSNPTPNRPAKTQDWVGCAGVLAAAAAAAAVAATLKKTWHFFLLFNVCLQVVVVPLVAPAIQLPAGLQTLKIGWAVLVCLLAVHVLPLACLELSAVTRHAVLLKTPGTPAATAVSV